MSETGAVVGTNGKSENGAGKADGKRLPPGITEGAQLFTCDPSLPKIGDHDAGCILAADDPLKDEHSHFSDTALDIDGLKKSIEAAGVDIIVDAVMRGPVPWIQDGRRRTRAMRKLFAEHKAAGTKPKIGYYLMIKAGLTDEQIATGALVKGFGRYDDTGIALAKKLDRFRVVYKWSPQKIADMIGQSRQTVNNVLSLLKLTEPWQQALTEGRVGQSSLYEIAKLKPEKQAEQYAAIVGGSASGDKVRKVDAQAAVNRAKAADPKAARSSDKTEPKAAKTEAKPTEKPAAKTSAKPAEKPAPVTATNVAPTPSQWRKLLAAFDDPECIPPRDPDLAEFRAAVKADPILLVRVAAGEEPLRKIPGLKKCFKWAGVNL